MSVFPSMKAMRPALGIMAGRTFGFVASFAIPMVLVRCFDAGQFATYRQLFLVYGTAYGIAQLGTAESLYYFLPRHPSRGGRWVGNAIVILAAAGAACVLLAILTAPAMARGFHNPHLVPTLPWLAVFLAAMLVSTVLEIAMIARRQHALAAATYAGSDVLRAALLSIPAAVTGRLDALLAGAIAFAVLRCAALAWYLSREFGRRLQIDWRSMLLQLRYAVPFGAAVAVGVVQLNFHQYAVAAWFDPATFVIYSVGCLQVPVVDILASSVANVMMVTMSEKIRRQEPALTIWHRTVEQLAYLFVPLSIVLMLSAREVIVILFTPAFAASAPIFTVVAATIALGALPVDAVLRVHAQTRFLLVLNVLQLAFVALAISWSIATWHLVGAVLVTAVGLAGAKALAVTRIAAIMRVPVRKILPWRSLAGVVASGALAAVPVVVLKSKMAMPPAVAVVAATAIYAVGYLGLMALLRSMGAVFVSPVSEPAA